MSGVDGMSVIAHWLVEISDPSGVTLRYVEDETVLAGFRRAGWTVTGPFVPAEQLRGAVEALRSIASRSPLYTSSEAGAIAVARRWLEENGHEEQS